MSQESLRSLVEEIRMNVGASPWRRPFMCICKTWEPPLKNKRREDNVKNGWTYKCVFAFVCPSFLLSWCVLYNVKWKVI